MIKVFLLLIEILPVLFLFLALNSMVQVADRPVTRQGLAGIKTQSQGTFQ